MHPRRNFWCFVLLGAFVFLAFSARAQAPAFHWATFLGDQRGVESFKVVADRTGGFYLASQSHRPLISFDGAGAVRWELTNSPNFNSITRVSDLDVFQNGDLLAALDTSSGTNTFILGQPVTPARGYLVRLTAQGNLVWLKSIENAGLICVRAIGNGFAVSGACTGNGPGKIDGVVVDAGPDDFFVASFGDGSHWIKTGRGAGSSVDNWVTSMGSDGVDLWVAGNAMAGQWSFGGTNLMGPGPFLARLDAQGNLHWARLAAENATYRAFAIGRDGAGHVGFRKSNGENLIAKFRADGSAVGDSPAFQEINSLAAGENLYILGDASPAGDWTLGIRNNDGLMLARGGDPGGRAYSSGKSAAILQDGSLVIAGHITPRGVFLDEFFPHDFSLVGVNQSAVFLGKMHFSEAAKPVFRVQPRGMRGIVGETLTLSAEVYSLSLPTLQWMRNHEPLIGKTNAQLVLTNLQMADAGEYQLMAMNGAGAATSSVARVTLNTVAVMTLAGSGARDYMDDADHHMAKFNAPRNPLVWSENEILVVDSSNHVVRSIGLAGVKTFAGTNLAGLQGGAALQARFSLPGAMTRQRYYDGGPRLMVTDAGNNGLRSLAYSTDTLLAGTVGTILGASVLTRPNSIAGADELTSVIVAETDGSKLWKETEGAIELFGGGDPGYVDGWVWTAKFSKISGLAKDARGNIYVADKGNNMVRKIGTDMDVITLAGSTEAGFRDGFGTEARFNQPSGVAVDADGNVYVTELGNHAVRRISPAGNVTTLAGMGSSGDAEGNAAQAMFNAPEGLCVRADGSLVIADTGNNKLRELRFVPAMATNTQEMKLTFSRVNGLTITLSAPPGLYHIESSAEVGANAHWEHGPTFEVNGAPVEQGLGTPPVAPRFYRAMQVLLY